jgi:predicted nuclease of predicted toxin-antitoxin system
MPWRPIDIQVATRIFKQNARFLLDENITPDALEYLKGEGFWARSVKELGLQGKDDSVIFAYAQKHSLVLLTSDADFLDDRKFPLNRVPCIIRVPSSSDSDAFVTAVILAVRFVAHSVKAYEGSKIELNGDGAMTIRAVNFGVGRQVSRYKLLGVRIAEEWVE